MHHIHKALAASAILSAVVLCGCSSDSGTEEHQRAPLEASRGEHDRDGGEHARGGEGEESGTELGLHESYDQVRNGARLILAYDPESNAFQGEVSNTTDKTLKRVRVEVHLSNGVELGPTTPFDLAPGMQRAVTLTATSEPFAGWTAHPEVGSGEHGREGQGEHQ